MESVNDASDAILSPPHQTTCAPTDRVAQGQWMVLLAAFLGWMFDGLEMGIFPLVARPALRVMLDHNEKSVGAWMGYITACFLIGAACGGLVFGWLGDKFGRIKAMTFSVLAYSVFTGLGYFAQTPLHLGVLRFLAALGMGGEWSLGVALVMECWPEKRRPILAGLIGAASNVGFLLVGFIAFEQDVSEESWRWMMLVGIAPALLTVLIRLFVPESEKWQASQKSDSKPLREVFSGKLLKPTLLGIVFASVALIGTWAAVQWIPPWVDKMVGSTMPKAKAVSQMCSAFGAIIGCIIAPLLGDLVGRRMGYFLLCFASLISCGILFRCFDTYDYSLLFMVVVVGIFSAAFYGWLPLYLPELFPTRVRATGQGVAFNSGRVIAAAGALLQGQLVGYFGNSYAKAGQVITLVYLIGMAVIWFAPETKGKPLPD